MLNLATTSPLGFVPSTGSVILAVNPGELREEVTSLIVSPFKQVNKIGWLAFLKNSPSTPVTKELKRCSPCRWSKHKAPLANSAAPARAAKYMDLNGFLVL